MPRVAKLLHANGHSDTIENWALSTGIPVNTLRSRLRIGWSDEEALEFKERVIEIDARDRLGQPNQNDDGTGRQVLGRQAKFLDDYLVTGKVTESCTNTGIDHTTYYRWIENDEFFRDACARIYEWTTQRLRDKVVTMLELPDQYKTLVQHPNILFFELKARFEPYKDNFNVNIQNNTLTLADTQDAMKLYWAAKKEVEGQKQPLLLPSGETVDGEYSET